MTSASARRAPHPTLRIAATSVITTIRVTNEWSNQLLRSRTAPPGKKVLTGGPPGGGFGGPPPLAESGLLGPATIASVRSK